MKITPAKTKPAISIIFAHLSQFEQTARNSLFSFQWPIMAFLISLFSFFDFCFGFGLKPRCGNGEKSNDTSKAASSEFLSSIVANRPLPLTPQILALPLLKGRYWKWGCVCNVTGSIMRIKEPQKFLDHRNQATLISSGQRGNVPFSDLKSTFCRALKAIKKIPSLFMGNLGREPETGKKVWKLSAILKLCPQDFPLSRPIQGWA